MYSFSALADLLPIRFESAHMDWETQSKEIRMEGSARIFGEEASIEADLIRIRFLSQEMEKAFSEQNLESLQAEGRVRLRHQDFQGRADKARYETQSQRLRLEGRPAEFRNPDIRITGDSIFYDHRLDEMQVEGRKERLSTLHYGQKGSDPPALVAHALSQDWNMTSRTLVFKGEVHIVQAGMTLRADAVTLRYQGKDLPLQTEKGEDPLLSIESVVAEGKVEITHPDGRASGERAIFIAQDDTITLTGSPARVERLGHVLQGPAIRMNRTTGEMEISGGVSGTLLQDKKKPLPLPF
jgi:lipopolysaccharide transport protein LptA